MPLANPSTVVTYLHKTYGLRAAKSAELLREPAIASILNAGMAAQSYDYFVAEQIMDAITDASRLPDEDTDAYDDWIDPEWAPSEEALLEVSELEQELEDGQEGDSELEVEDEDEDDEDWEDDDELEDEDDDEEDDEEDDENDEDEPEEVSSGNLRTSLESRWDALRAAHLGSNSHLPQ